MKKRVLIVLLCFVGALSSAFAAEKKVQGVVISSEDNLPLIGASVYVTAEDLKKAGSAQTTMGVITDVDGQFSIAIPAGITRFFCSYVGYDVLEVKLVPGKEHYEITLHASSQMLDAVVVTGYQTVERRKLTAAVSKLDISDETIGAVKSIDQALAGQIAGLSVSPTSGAPGAPAKIRIRGTASLNGTQDPLWVLDGIPLEGTDVPEPDELNDITNMKQSSIAGLNPADIENITILKDAAATAIYGARAANGVIVITTKKGKVGKPVISFSSRFTYTPTLSLDRLNLLNSAEKVGLEMDMIRNNYSPDNHKGGVYNILSNYNELSAFQNGGWDALSSDTQAAINRLKSVNTNWGDILFRDAFSQEYNLSLSGGTERVTYYTSFGYYKEDGNVDGVGMDRFNLVGKTSYKVNSILKVGASMFANRRKNTNYLTDAYGMSNPVFYSRKANPYFELYDKNGNYNYDYDIQNNTDKDLGFNIFEERQNTSNESVVNSFSSIFDAELRFNDKWKLTSQFGYQLEKTSREEIADWESYAMRYYYKLSEYSQGGETKHFLPEGGMQKSYENSNSQITWKAMGEYRDSFNDIHELEVMAGTELRKTWYETLFSAGYGFDRKTLTTKPVIFPNESYATSFPLHQTTYKENAYVSFYSTASYSLLNRYTVGGSIRFDGSDLFGVDKKYRYLPLYSVSALWRLSQEPFMQQAKWVDNLVFRASYGLQGNIINNIKNKNMDEMELMMHLHRNNKRQGPGSEDATNLAVTLAKIDREKSYKIADIGCGTGEQTISLAKMLKGNIIAVDLFEEFLEKLKEDSKNENITAHIETLAASMDKLPFEKEEFDIIWSEGAVYNIGFKNGINYWKEFLKPGGILAVSELSWITNCRPKELEDFWNGEYAEMDTIAGKIKALEEAGYKVLGHFILPDDCWLDNYYNPLLDSHKDFMEKFGDNEVARVIVERDIQEADFYKKYKDYYSYGFYIAQKL